jgi:hypothetical protein
MKSIGLVLSTHHPDVLGSRANAVRIELGTAWRWTGIAWEVSRLSTGWTVRGLNPSVDEIFLIRPVQHLCQPSILYSGYRVFPGGKAGGAWC